MADHPTKTAQAVNLAVPVIDRFDLLTPEKARNRMAFKDSAGVVALEREEAVARKTDTDNDCSCEPTRPSASAMASRPSAAARSFTKFRMALSFIIRPLCLSSKQHVPVSPIERVAARRMGRWNASVARGTGLTSAGLQALRDEHTRTIEPARALAAETLTLERPLSGLVNQAYQPAAQPRSP